MTTMRPLLIAALAFSITTAACGTGDAGDGGEPSAAPVTDTAGIRVVAPEEAAQTIADPADDLVILDIRTQEEFAEARIEGAVMLDFYRNDFPAALAELDRDVPYVLYCRSGNRSSQARAIMADLGFRDVEDIDGGIVGWRDAGLPLVND